MSALPPIATKLVRRNEASRCATRRHLHRSEEPRLFDHLVGASEHGRGTVIPIALVDLEVDGDMVLGRRLHWNEPVASSLRLLMLK